MAGVQLVGFAGSLRRDSINRRVLRRLVEVAPEGVVLEEIDLASLPLYDADLEERGGDAAVLELKARVDDADGLVIVTPEYNFSIPGVTKNAVDWLSRPAGQGPINGKPVGMVATTGGRSGGAGVLSHLGDVVGILSPQLYAEKLGIASYRHRKGEDGFPDTELTEELSVWLAGFADFVRAIDVIE